MSAIVFAFGQTPETSEVPPVGTPVPPIAFEEWKEVPGTPESYKEYTLSFPSALTTEHAENNVVPIRVLLPNKPGPHPVLVQLHYWGAYDLKVERALAEHLLEGGVATVMVALPYHLGRTPAGHSSGELAILPDPEYMIRTMTQGVFDVRRTLDFIETRPEFDQGRIGISGTSLGSLVATLSYALDTRIDTAAFMLAGIDLAHIIWHSSRLVEQREGLRRRGFTESRLREALKPIEPAELLPARPGVPTFVIAARYDTVIPPPDTHKLLALLPNAQSTWLDTGHYGGIFVQGRVLRTVADFFIATFKGEEFKAPSTLTAPTIRVGVLANPRTGLQVGAGLDIWKSNARGDFFSTLLITPRGPHLFIGARIDKGFSVGGFGSAKGVSFGGFWSTVL